MQDAPHAGWTSPGDGLCHPGCLLATGEIQLRKRAWKRKVRPTDLARLVQVTAGLCMVCRRCHASIVEHCHFTGRVRGLVCRNCNGTIAILEGAIDGQVVFRRPCPCTYPDRLARLMSAAGDEPAGRHRDLEQATYDFLDHAQDAVGHDIKNAFTWLVDHPYPAGRNGSNTNRV